MSNEAFLQTLGGEEGCRRLAQDFYSRVAASEELRPLFPGKSLRCATEEFAAFLIQFLGGDESQTQYRWWLSLRESHSRFKISEEQRVAWLGLMDEALNSVVEDPAAREQFESFFRGSSAYILGGDEEIETGKLSKYWDQQVALDEVIEHLVNQRGAQAIDLAREFVSRPSVFVGILARMMEADRPQLTKFILQSIPHFDAALSRFNGRTLLHFAASCSSLPIVQDLLRLGVDPNVLDNGGHAPLYRAAGGTNDDNGAAVAIELVKAGAVIDHCGGVSRSTALHQAARFGNVKVATALLNAGASIKARDKKGLTALDRARNCRQPGVIALLTGKV